MRRWQGHGFPVSWHGGGVAAQHGMASMLHKTLERKGEARWCPGEQLRLQQVSEIAKNGSCFSTLTKNEQESRQSQNKRAVPQPS